MAFQNSIAQWLSADGIPVVYYSNINLNNNVAVKLPVSGGFGTAPNSLIKPRAGYIRIKSNIINKNATVLVGGIQAGDGVANIANLYVGDAGASANGQFYDASFFFWFDWGVANINIANIATTVNTATYDVELVGMQ